MKIYISGKISGLDLNDAKALFAKAVVDLANAYPMHTTVNPFDINGNSENWHDCMLADIKELFLCDAIYMLENWRDSRGARIEHAIAVEMGKHIFYTLPI